MARDKFSSGTWIEKEIKRTFDPVLSQKIDCMNFVIDSTRGPKNEKDIGSSSQIR